MRKFWSIVIKEGLLTGSIFCIAVLAYLRISPALSSEDYPDNTRLEILALENYGADLYEQILSTILAITPLIWGMFRILNKISFQFRELKLKNRLPYMYLGLLLWNFIIFNMDLLIVDWFIICYLKAPISGIEHLLSNEAVSSYQTFNFHFKEHYFFIGSYLVNILSPLIMILIYQISHYIKSPFKVDS